MILRTLADEHAALRRVATLVADEAAPDVIFASVAEEIARILVADRCAIGRFEADDSMTVVAYWSNEEPKVPVGTRIGLQGDDVTAAVRDTRRPILIDDHEAFSGPLIDYARKLGSLPRSTVVAPIFVEGRVWGSIFASTMVVEIAEGTESRVVEFAELIATAIANTEARRELERVAAEQRALRTAAILVASGASPSEVFAAITALASELFEVPFASLLRYGPDEKATMIAGCAACSAFVGQTWTVPGDDPGIVRAVVGSRRPARIEDHSGVHGPLGEAARSLGIGSVVGVPVIVDGSVWGVLAVGAAQDGPPLPADASNRLVGFTELVTTTLINAETRNSFRRLADEQAALRRVATLVAEGVTGEPLFDFAAREVAHVFDVRSVTIDRYDPDGYTTVVASRDDPGFPVGSRWPLDGPSLGATVLKTARPARIDDYADVDSTSAAVMREFALKAAVGVPILVDRHVWGVICVAAADGAPLPEGIEVRLADFTELLATGIARAESRAALARLADEQAALRRVATLVARGVAPGEVFASVAEEVAVLFELPWVGVMRYDSDASFSVVATWGEHPFPTGSRWPLDGPSTFESVLRTGRPARIRDYTGLPGTVAEAARNAGIVGGIGAPIIVEGTTWGVIAAPMTADRTIPDGAEERLNLFTELLATAIANAQSRAELAASETRARELANEQAALRRVATLVAQGASPDELFSAVADEVAGIIDIPVVGVHRYEADGTFTMLGIAGETTFTVGSRWPVEKEGIAGMILATGRPARKDDYSKTPGRLGEAMREELMVSTLGVPIVVDGSIWGFMVAAAKPGRPIPTDTEARLARFTELVATAVSNATTRTDLLTSRARLVSAADETRRRLERDLHDGIQQWLVALALRARKAAGLSAGGESPVRELSGLADDLVAVTDELREISRGIHPAILSDAGLDDALKALARRSAIRVDLDVSFQGRYDPTLEATVYYVMAESITNAAKHAQASTVSVRGGLRGEAIELEIRDDGVGGADPGRGTGMIGLKDRVDTLGGTISFGSPAGAGTTIRVRLPASPHDGKHRPLRRSDASGSSSG